MNLALVACGGAVGACLRFWIDGLVRRRAAGAPFGTLTVNVLGSLLIGLVLGLLPDPAAMPGLTLGLAELDAPVGPLAASQWRLLLATGVCGALTTYSTFAGDTFMEIEAGRYGPAFGYVVATVLLTVCAVFAGLMLGTGLIAGAGVV